MIRPHTFPCTIPRADADALHRASGRVYSETLVWHYRVYRLQRRKVFLLARNARQVRAIEHKVTRAIMNHAKAQGARRLVVGDLRDLGSGKRLAKQSQQKISGWSHGRQIAYLTYKLAAEGIGLARQSEAYASKTCPACGTRTKPKGRN